jgi:hypothetical protein
MRLSQVPRGGAWWYVSGWLRDPPMLGIGPLAEARAWVTRESSGFENSPSDSTLRQTGAMMPSPRKLASAFFCSRQRTAFGRRTNRRANSLSSTRPPSSSRSGPFTRRTAVFYSGRGTVRSYRDHDHQPFTRRTSVFYSGQVSGCVLSRRLVTIGTSHVLRPVTRTEYHRAIGGEKWQNALGEDHYASLYYIYEDFTRDFEWHREADWPSMEVGAATLNLMLSNWSRSESIRNHGNSLSRCCSFAQPECAVLVWSRNCLRLVSDLPSDEVERMREYLARE